LLLKSNTRPKEYKKPTLLSFASQKTYPLLPRLLNLKALNVYLKWQIYNKIRELTFVKLDSTSFRPLVFSDMSFAINKDLTLQIGYIIIVLVDCRNKANIDH
jgi:hypothetical protein